ncbi:MAG: alpha/beta hydrolase [Coriobacteriia bacterium]|nr:alpha/beta hydrolase [Coriobacteriia bacterium]
MRTWLKVAGITFAVVLVVAVVGFLAWTRMERYPAFQGAAALAEQAKTESGWYVFGPDGQATTGVIFYPGGLVDPAAYAPLMERLSQDGVLAIIVPMPLDLAVFGIDRADGVIAEYPEVDSWVIAGHSLGGSMAAEYVKRNPDAIQGIAFLASYPADSTDLSASTLRATSTYGTEDGVAGDVFEGSLRLLPGGTPLDVIEGGNHAQFGDYGPQKGDGTASISREQQQQQAASTIMRLVELLN